MIERADANAETWAAIERRATLIESCRAVGRFNAVCYDRLGRIKWREDFDNLVTTEGKNLALDTLIEGSAYTVTGPYLGLISGVSYSAVASTDTGVQINGSNGWKEAGGTNDPTYSGTRKTPTWNAAGSGAKSFASTVSFSITSTGTVKGSFIILGSAAVVTIDDAHGTLWSAGLFSADRNVDSTDTLTVGYSTSL
jgi:hypothetical protein